MPIRIKQEELGSKVTMVLQQTAVVYIETSGFIFLITGYYDLKI